MKLLALNNRDQVSSFILRVYKLLEADGFLWMDENEYYPNVDGDKAISYSYGDELGPKSKIFIFDIFLVPTLVFLKKYNHCEFVYIQHGVFSDITVDFRRKKKTLPWVVRSLKIALRFISNFGLSVKSLALLGKIFRYGGWSARSAIGDLPISIDLAIFWSQLDKANMSDHFSRIIKDYQLVESPDKSLLKLRYSSSGRVVYISQPLVEDSLVSEIKYERFIQTLERQYGQDLLVIKHPRLVRDFSNQKPLSEITTTIDSRLVIGHYSSLILSVDHLIPVEFEDFGVENIKIYCSYTEKSLQKIRLDPGGLKSFESIPSLL